MISITDPPERFVATEVACGGCGALVFPAVCTRNGRRSQLEAEPVPDGDALLVSGVTGYVPVGADTPVPAAWLGDRYRRHACPSPRTPSQPPRGDGTSGGPAPILSRLECRDCGGKLEWNGERWGCPACIAAEEDAEREAEEEARDRAAEDRADETASW